MESLDQYAASKANLRDTVKWLATTIAALVALVVAGAPFSNFGKLELFSLRFNIAAACLVVAGVCLLFVWRILLRLLRSDAVFPSQLRATYRDINDADGREIAVLRVHLKAHEADLLPPRIASFDALEAAVNDAWVGVHEQRRDAVLLEDYKGYRASLELYLNYATFARLRQRIEDHLSLVLALTGIAAVALFGFAYQATSTTAAPTDRVVIVQPAGPPAAGGAAPSLAPVRFAPGSARLETSGLAAINAARDYLRAHEAAGLVLLAHTDTTGGEARNRTVAADRGAIVRRTLLQEGGVAPARVFVAEVPKTDLPNVTLPGVSDEDNRSVEFLIVTMSRRP